MNKPNPIPKAVALILISIFGAFIMLKLENSTMAKLDSMSATEYFERQRLLHRHHSLLYHYLVVLVMGGFYLGVVEFIAYVVGLLFKKQVS